MRLRRLTSADHADASVATFDAAAARDEGRQLAADGALVDAVEALARANRELDDPDLAAELVDLRLAAAAAYGPGDGRSPWPPSYTDPFPDAIGRIPEVTSAELDADTLGGAVAHHGALIVRGAFRPSQVERVVDGIERTRAHEEGWYRPVDARGRKKIVALRQMVHEQGGTWLADSPRATALVLDELEQAGVTGAITGHLGERPFFSLQKSTLRRAPAEDRIVAWHQDGSFLDVDVRTMNVWVALSRCGGDYPSPGLQVAPFRVPEVLAVDGALTPHSISPDLVAEVTREHPVVVPAFGPGDAMLFDERFLHRTYVNADMTEDRYALECWFFAPSHPASGYWSLLA
jgi:hypothetical protein